MKKNIFNYRIRAILFLFLMQCSFVSLAFASDNVEVLRTQSSQQLALEISGMESSDTRSILVESEKQGVSQRIYVK